MIRRIVWACGHQSYQRLTKTHPAGSTKIPERCPYCGRLGMMYSDEEERR